MAQLGISVSLPVAIACDYEVPHIFIHRIKALLFPFFILINNIPKHDTDIGPISHFDLHYIYICTSDPRKK